MKQTNSRKINYRQNRNLSEKLQPIAIRRFYSKVWPKANIIELDKEHASQLASIIDRGGADKILQFPNGQLAFLAQRFRDWEYRKKKDWTLRDTELNKILQSLKSGGFIAGWYAYGYANPSQSDFVKFYLIKLDQTIKYLLPMIRRGRYPHIPNKNGGPGFYAIPWNQIPRDCFEIMFPEDSQLKLL